MARAANVYIVTWEGRPVAAFTVKHECRAFLQGRIDETTPHVLDWKVSRYPDGWREGTFKVVTFTVSEFMA
jgi:hypothetical protein